MGKTKRALATVVAAASALLAVATHQFDREAREGHTLLVAPEGAGAVSHAGQEYAPDENGLVEVPHAAVEVLVSHGYTVAPIAPVVADPAAASGDAPLGSEGEAEHTDGDAPGDEDAPDPPDDKPPESGEPANEPANDPVTDSENSPAAS